jgi:hypothetical protein
MSDEVSTEDIRIQTVKTLNIFLKESRNFANIVVLVERIRVAAISTYVHDLYDFQNFANSIPKSLGITWAR